MVCAVLVAGAFLSGGEALAAPLADVVRQAEERRVAVVERLSRSTVAVFARDADNGGSGVVIDPSGLVATNYHVVEPCGSLAVCGLSDGRVRPAILLGLDPTGDIALVQLLGKGAYPAAEIGDSDLVRVGDEAIVAGNPLMVSEDFTPSVSYGVISGVHRYQPPSGTLLEYADCLQTDAAINPGNSGGPLFDGAGRLIGINGRGSFEKRGRVNVGVGYAVSINQVRRFVEALRAGHVVDHASLGATVVTRQGPSAIVSAIERNSDAYRGGLRAGDEVVSIEGRDTPTANAVLNVLGVLPAGWRTRIEYRREGRLQAIDVRLGALHSAGELAEAAPPADPPPDLEAAGLYEARDGYANYAATRAATKRLLRRLGDALAGDLPLAPLGVWDDAISGDAVEVTADAQGAQWLAADGEFTLSTAVSLAEQAAPPTAPPLLGAVWVAHTLATGQTDRLDSVEAIGRLPWEALGEPHDVLAVTHRGLRVEVYLDPASGAPRGVTAWRDEAEDAVRIDLGTPITIRFGDRLVAELSLSR